jgi:hypothetical protein
MYIAIVQMQASIVPVLTVVSHLSFIIQNNVGIMS